MANSNPTSGSAGGQKDPPSRRKHFCPHCGSESPSAAGSCPTCGKAMNPFEAEAAGVREPLIGYVGRALFAALLGFGLVLLACFIAFLVVCAPFLSSIPRTGGR
jgi:hypothetical protein